MAEPEETELTAEAVVVVQAMVAMVASGAAVPAEVTQVAVAERAATRANEVGVAGGGVRGAGQVCGGSMTALLAARKVGRARGSPPTPRCALCAPGAALGRATRPRARAHERIGHPSIVGLALCLVCCLV